MLYVTITDRWVSGIFERAHDARDYLQEIPAPGRSKHILSQFYELNYPVYVVEDSFGFQLMTAEAALENIRKCAPTASEDDCCMTLYRVDCDYRPRMAGEDEMGRLHHVHVDNETLRRAQRLGRAALRLMKADT